MKQKKYILIFLLILCFFTRISYADNIFWGTKAMNEDSGLVDKVAEDLVKSKKYVPQFTSPVPGSTITIEKATLEVAGLAYSEIDAVEVKLDNRAWQKAVGKKGWRIAFSGVGPGQHTIYARLVKVDQKGAVVSMSVTVELKGPEDFQVSVRTTNSIHLKWTSMDGATGYLLYRADTLNGSYTKIATIPSFAWTYCDSDLEFARQYYYKLQGDYSGVNTAYSDPVEGITKGMNTVDPVSNTGEYNSIAVSGSNIYISYYDRNNNDLKVAQSTNAGKNWITNRIDLLTGDVGKYSSITSEDDKIYISHFNDTVDGLRFARLTNKSSTWQTNSIITGGSIGLYSSIAVNEDNIYVSYMDDTADDLMFSRSSNRGTTWSNKTIVAGGSVGWQSSIAVQGSNIYISYRDATAQSLMIAVSSNKGLTWRTNTVDNTADVGEYSSIGVNGSYVYISYYDNSSGNLKMARSFDKGSSWILVTVDSSVPLAGKYSSIGINNNNVYICYYDETNETLKFAKSIDQGNTWSLQVVDTDVWDGTDTGTASSLAVSGSIIYISYWDGNRDLLKFAKSINAGDTW